MKLLPLLLIAVLSGLPTPSAGGCPNHAACAMAALQRWYNPATGLWRTTGWWNSANALNVVVHYTAVTHDPSYEGDIATTFEQHRHTNFLNRFYDDEGWWALTWIDAYDLTANPRYLDMAKRIFQDMTTGWDDHCGGGIWWNKDRRYKNAIPNELFLTAAARLHIRTPGDRGPGSYQDWALREWKWFDSSGMENSEHLVNDGLTASCENNHGTPWTYNQGVILGGLTDLYRMTRDRAYLKRARQIADAATKALVDANGILQEPCEKHGDCGGDGPQFKGIFIRNLAYVNRVVRSGRYRRFIKKNAAAIESRDRDEDHQLGLRWDGPFDRADASRQSSALDALIAAEEPR